MLKPLQPGMLQRLWMMPHRLGFLLGALSLVLLALWWSGVLISSSVPVLPAVFAHGVMMPLGSFPLFMLGFLFTAGPRWLGINHAPAHAGMMLGFFLGVVLVIAGLHVSLPAVLAGLLMMVLAWAWALLAWIRCILASQLADKGHAWRIAVAMGVGLLAMMSAAVWAKTGDAEIWMATRTLALWGFLLPVFITVSHRMIPFFTQSALALPVLPWRPMGLLDAWLAGCVAHSVATLAGWQVAAALADVAMVLGFGLATVRWGLMRSMKVRLLAMLHLSFAWLVPACLLQAAASMGWCAASAPAHALATGLFVTMLVGFVTRVTYGHGGRPLQADSLTWWIYCGLHLAALIRVGLALLAVPGIALQLVLLAWAGLLVAWAARMIPIYLRPRLDGKAG
ncbi:NnrS family protein [Burkholderiaceae bacterium DAT-1]|nr:NnrS family protein [Burkholderiaceae bacterium DAT-1]